MPILYDMHTHSAYSTDSRTPMEEQVRAAIAKGLKGICLTDHMDYEFPFELFDSPCEGQPFVFDEKPYKEEISVLKKKYPDIWIGTGVECGIQPDALTCGKNRALVGQKDWDFIIGSVHLVDRMDPYNALYWEGYDKTERVRHYFEGTLTCIQIFSDFDTLGHLDYAVRYAPADLIYNPSEYLEIIDEIFKFIIKKDIALEINASGLFSSAGQINPHPVFLKRYAELGGELITIGSDGHTPERIAGKFNFLESYIKEAGLRQYVTYEMRKPVFHDL